MVTVRLAGTDDISALVPLMDEASGGIIEYLFGDLKPGRSAHDLLAEALKTPRSRFYYGHTRVAVVDGEVTGLIHGYPINTHLRALPRWPPWTLLRLLWRARIFLKMMKDVPHDGFYIHSLGVVASFRGRGLGHVLLDDAVQRAREAGLTSLSLHVWADNGTALRLYRGYGFREARRYPVTIGSFLHHPGEQVMMVLKF